MCVPESALRFYEERLEKEAEAYALGFDNLEDYYNYLADEADREYKRQVEWIDKDLKRC